MTKIFLATDFLAKILMAFYLTGENSVFIQVQIPGYEDAGED